MLGVIPFIKLQNSFKESVLKKEIVDDMKVKSDIKRYKFLCMYAEIYNVLENLFKI